MGDGAWPFIDAAHACRTVDDGVLAKGVGEAREAEAPKTNEASTMLESEVVCIMGSNEDVQCSLDTAPCGRDF